MGIFKYIYIYIYINFIYGEGLSNFSSDVIEEGHEMRNMDEIMTILHKGNNHEKINQLVEMEILKAATSLKVLVLNDVINGRNDPLYKLLLSVDSYNST